MVLSSESETDSGDELLVLSSESETDSGDCGGGDEKRAEVEPAMGGEFEFY